MDFLVKYKRAFTQLLVAGILAIMIGAVLLVVSYVVINAIVITAGSQLSDNTVTHSVLFNTSFYGNINNITSALNIAGIGLIVAGIAAIVYMLIGLGGAGTGGRR